MKTKQAIAVICGTMVWAGAALAQTFETNFTFSVNAAIPDGSVFGLTQATNLMVAANGGSAISDLSVSLNISGGYNGDLYGYLAGPNGLGFAILLDRVGVSNSASASGYGDSGFNVTFSEAAANSIQYYQNYTNPAGGALFGTWLPEGVNIIPTTNDPTAFLAANPTATLSSFTGDDANGVWTLFLADLSSGGQSTLVSWGLDITTVPEPQTWAVGALGVFLLSIIRKKSTGRE
jgi:subtilisin-like proprotein convertase family protein